MNDAASCDDGYAVSDAGDVLCCSAAPVGDGRGGGCRGLRGIAGDIVALFLVSSGNRSLWAGVLFYLGFHAVGFFGCSQIQLSKRQ